MRRITRPTRVHHAPAHDFRGNFRGRGFTLIEVSVVLVLMALLAATAAVSARGLVGGATRDEVLAQVASLDAQARRHAERTGRVVELTIDTHARSMALQEARTNERGVQPLGGYRLPRGFTLTSAWRERDGRADADTRFILTYDAYGKSPTWAVTIQSPDQGDTTLLVAGLTGQTTHLENDAQAQDILAQVHRRDPD